MYIANTYGAGRVMQIISSEIKMFYSQTLPKDDGSGADTTYAKVGTYFAVTPEVVTNNNIDLVPVGRYRGSVAEQRGRHGSCRL